MNSSLLLYAFLNDHRLLLVFRMKYWRKVSHHSDTELSFFLTILPEARWKHFDPHPIGSAAQEAAIQPYCASLFQTRASICYCRHNSATIYIGVSFKTRARLFRPFFTA
jgi:hypothetical protein